MAKGDFDKLSEELRCRALDGVTAAMNMQRAALVAFETGVSEETFVEGCREMYQLIETTLDGKAEDLQRAERNRAFEEAGQEGTPPK